MVKFKGMLDGTTKKFAAKKVNKNVAKLALLEVIGLLPASLLLLANKTHICQIIGWFGVGCVCVGIVAMAVTRIVKIAQGDKAACLCDVAIDDDFVEWAVGKNVVRKPIKDALKIVDHGDFYDIVYSEGFLNAESCICQKTLIVEGTTEDFERLFEGKILRVDK